MTRLTTDAVIAALFAGAVMLGVLLRGLGRLVDRPNNPTPPKESHAR